jgi:hypothetical protein
LFTWLPVSKELTVNDTITYFMANHWPAGHYPIRLEDVFNEEELEELRRSGQALYRDGSKTPDATVNDPPRKPAAEEN